MAKTQTYEIVTIPPLQKEPEPEPNLLKLAEKLYNLRMNALQNSADAFASSYAAESQDGIARSISRLTNSKAVQFVALRNAISTTGSSGNGDDIDKLLSGEWVGLNVLLGPEEGSELSVPSANLDPFRRMTARASDQAPAWHSSLIHRPAKDGELHFHINGMFVDPSARGAGLGRELMEAALSRAEEMAIAAKSKLRVSLSVYGHNVAARKLYEDTGFKTLVEEQSRSRPDFMAVHMEKLWEVQP